MRKLHNLIFRDVRCFSSHFDVPIAPLTLLVGDNSSGKSTFLALYRIAWDLAHASGSRRIDFNEDPFLLGGFDQIATYRGGRAGRSEDFEIGMRVPIRANSQNELLGEPNNQLTAEYRATFHSSGSHPVIKEENFACGKLALQIVRASDDQSATMELQYDDQKHLIRGSDADRQFRFLERDVPSDLMFVSYSFSRALQKQSSEKEPGPQSLLHAFEALDQVLRLRRSRNRKRPIAGAPVRTRPERVYTPVSDSPVPEGGHVPMVLAKMYFEHREKWISLKSELDAFGQNAGLFKSIEIKSLGRHEGDPFQLRFKLYGPATNVLDMGYGVSQVLPILVESLLSADEQTQLVQQPEVHLHPKGQAELGSFLANLVARQRRQFVVETHSDYLIDRIRMDIRDERGISSEDVQILFFDRSGGDLKIHRIGIDNRGELVDVPPTYRQFFLAEENRFLMGGAS